VHDSFSRSRIVRKRAPPCFQPFPTHRLPSAFGRNGASPWYPISFRTSNIPNRTQSLTGAWVGGANASEMDSGGEGRRKAPRIIASSLTFGTWRYSGEMRRRAVTLRKVIHLACRGRSPLEQGNTEFSAARAIDYNMSTNHNKRSCSCRVPKVLSRCG
jgi:hypothetical protein